MPLMFKSAIRQDGKLQPHIKAGLFNIRLPLIIGKLKSRKRSRAWSFL